jgi:hypothetical protein
MNRFAPKLEALDDRIVPACTWTLEGGVLTIIGSQRADVVDVQDDGTTLTVTCDGETLDLPADAEVTDVVLRLGAGNDTVTYSQTGDLATDSARSLLVCLGNGHDTFTGTLTGGLVDTASLDVRVRGDNGLDTLNFSGDGDVAEGAALSVKLYGGNAKDTIAADYAGVLLAGFDFVADGGNGKDDISADLTFDSGSTGTPDARVWGQNGKDTLSLLVTDNSAVDDGNPETGDESQLGESLFVVYGGRGPDSVETSDLADELDGKVFRGKRL